jgi:hypothetical protein
LGQRYLQKAKVSPDDGTGFVRTGTHRIMVKSKYFYLSYSLHVAILHYAKNYFSKVLYFPKIYNHTSLHGPIASGATVDPTSQVCSSTMLVLTIAGS